MMKNTVILFFLAIVSFSFHSCSNEEKELQLIIEAYEQQITEDMVLDLEMKFEYSTLVDTITFKDSLDFYLKQFCEVYGEAYTYSKECENVGLEVLNYEDSIRNDVTEMLATAEDIRAVLSSQSQYLSSSKIDQAYNIIAYAENLDKTFQENKYVFAKIAECDSNSSAVVGYVVESKYELNNPLLDTKQTLTKKHLFSTDLNSIIKSM